MVRAGRVAGRRPDPLVALGNEVGVRQRLVRGVAPQLAPDPLVQPLRERLGKAIGERLGEDRRIVVVGRLELGDETDAPQIAELIVQRRAEQPITTTDQLCAIVCEARDFTLKRAAGAKLHPATRTFQALRILVNRELASLTHLLRVLPAVLKPGGRAAIISFHSGEDRLVKAAFKDGERTGVYSRVSESPDRPGGGERFDNPRSRSAKLRWAERA